MRHLAKWFGVVILVVGVGIGVLAGLTEWDARHDATLPLNAKIDRIAVYKSRHELVLLSNGRPIRAYQVALGNGGLGPKMQEGDGRTPEGR